MSTETSRPEWFAAFLADRGTRKPSPHTMKAYRQDFDAIATLLAGDPAGAARMSLGDIMTDSMRTAFSLYAETREAASIQRCWSTSNVLCTFLYTSELIGANPATFDLVGFQAPSLTRHPAPGCLGLSRTKLERQTDCSGDLQVAGFVC